MRYLLIILALVSFQEAKAAKGLVIHAAEIGIGKFHRHDNEVHPYGGANAWTPYVLPKDADATTPQVIENADHSVTIFFSTLEELLQKSVEVSQQRNEPIGVLNINGHGLPGAMWFPADDQAKNGFECWQWNSAATGSDVANYDQYYSPVAKKDVLAIRDYSQTGGHVGCVTGLSEWKKGLSKVSDFKKSLAATIKVNLLSCVVGLGPVGDKFTTGLGATLSNSDQAQIRSSLYFGLGDWSMPEGMGFWDYQTDDQLEHDNSIYGVNRKDREIMQKGHVRVSAVAKGDWKSTVVEGQEFMSLDRQSINLDGAVFGTEAVIRGVARPQEIRIVGTNVHLSVK